MMKLSTQTLLRLTCLLGLTNSYFAHSTYHKGNVKNFDDLVILEQFILDKKTQQHPLVAGLSIKKPPQNILTTGLSIKKPPQNILTAGLSIKKPPQNILTAGLSIKKPPQNILTAGLSLKKPPYA
jgi:hypothetical protein